VTKKRKVDVPGMCT